MFFSCFLFLLFIIYYSAIDMKELALQISTDPDHKFDLALSLDDLDTAYNIASSLSPPPSSQIPTTTTTTPSQITPTTETDALTQIKWKSLGDRALSLWRFDLAKECFIKAGDLGSLLLIVLSVGDRKGVDGVVQLASTFFFFRVIIIVIKI